MSLTGIAETVFGFCSDRASGASSVSIQRSGVITRTTRDELVSPGDFVVVPKNTWHSARTQVKTKLLFVTLNYLIGRYINPPAAYKSFKAYPHFGNPQYPDGGVRSSITELSQFLVAVLNNQDSRGQPLLSDSMYEEMFKLQLPESVSANQRFFWRDNEMDLTGHMGSDLGVFTAMYFDRHSKDGFIILMNRGMDQQAANAMKKIAMRLLEL